MKLVYDSWQPPPKKKKRRQNIVFRQTEMKRQSAQPPDVVEFSLHQKKNNATHILPALEGTTTTSVVLMFVFFRIELRGFPQHSRDFYPQVQTAVLLRSDDEPRSDDTTISAGPLGRCVFFVALQVSLKGACFSNSSPRRR